MRPAQVDKAPDIGQNYSAPGANACENHQVLCMAAHG